MVDALREFAKARIAYYGALKLNKLLAKDIVMFAARGVTDAEGFAEEAFRAHESSSEEGVMGTAWQGVAKNLANAIEAGDLMCERDGALYVVEVKSQTNTLNSASGAQTVRSLKAKVKYQQSFSRQKKVQVLPAIGVVRGKSSDKVVAFKSSKARGENPDIEGYEYRRIVGREFWKWMTGYDGIIDLIGDLDDIDAPEVVLAREESLRRLKSDLYRALERKGLGRTISDVLKLT